jgi:large subunit ribosomal protein L18
MSTTAAKQQKRTRRHNRIRAKVSGTADCPRLAVYRSNKAIYAQLIDDEKGTTIAAADSRTADGKTVRERAHAVGGTIAAAAKKAKIERAVFDRGGFLFTGAIKEVAEGAREGGLAM